MKTRLVSVAVAAYTPGRLHLRRKAHRPFCAAWILLLIAVALPATGQAQFSFTTNNGAITITGYSGPGGSVTVPGMTNGLPVTSIGDLAFYYCPSLTNVTFPNNIATIGDFAFAGCINLTGVLLPDSISSLGEGIFDNCTSLTNITIPDAVTSLKASSFYDCTNLISVTVGVGVTNIGDYAFYWCSNLTGIYFWGDRPSLGSFVFLDDNDATVYYLPGTTGWGTTLGGPPALPWNPPIPFNYTTNNGAITITGYTGTGGPVSIPKAINGLPVTAIDQSAFVDRTSLASLRTSSPLASIGDFAFDRCLGLTNITLSGTVTNLGTYVFAWCSGLASVAVPQNVTAIGDRVFWRCTGLTGITVDALNPCFSSVAGVLFDKSQKTLIQYPPHKAGDYTVPASVTNIADSAFYLCTSLDSITIPDSVSNIGDYAFYSCSRLNSVRIPQKITIIGVQAFFQCSGLTNIALPQGLTSIEDYAFAYCIGLPSITIPSSVYVLSSQAFSSCATLTGVFFKGNAPGPATSVFSGDINTTLYYLPGTSGWRTIFDTRPTALWNPQMQTGAESVGVQTNQFRFNITGTPNIPLVIEACSNLMDSTWALLQGCTLTNGSIYFGDLQWTNYPTRFYRLRSP